MEPVYFPFTYVSPSAAALLGACFSRTVVYQPLSNTVPPNLKTWAEAGRFDIRVPVDTDSDKLLNLLEEYQKWASLHEGRNLKFFKTQGGRVPFFDDGSAHQLSTDIKKRAAGEVDAPAPEPLFDARVFLAVAQEFDSRQGDLQNGLAAYREMEQKFLKDLKGEPEIPDIGLGGGPALHAGDPGGHMTEKRLESFARLARETRAEDRLFITTSRAVFDAVLEIIDPAEEVFRIEAMPVPENSVRAAFQSELSAHIQQLLESTPESPETVTFPKAGPGGGPRFSLTLCRTRMEREAFLNACIDPAAASTPKTAGKPDARSILICFIDGTA